VIAINLVNFFLLKISSDIIGAEIYKPKPISKESKKTNETAFYKTDLTNPYLP